MTSKQFFYCAQAPKHAKAYEARDSLLPMIPFGPFPRNQLDECHHNREHAGASHKIDSGNFIALTLAVLTFGFIPRRVSWHCRFQDKMSGLAAVY